MNLAKLIQPHSRTTQKEDHWIPLSDLMTGLMIMFMLIAIVFMIQVESQSQKIKNIAIIYDAMRSQLYTDLQAEFAKDLPKWGATLDRDLTIRFQEPDVLFDTGEAVLKPKFIQILDNFFPRYVKIIAGPKYKESIEEIRIEGHTSSQWAAWSSVDVAYFRNMELSQSRTRSALEHVLLLPKVANEKAWLRARLTANGLSSSHLRLNPDGSENRDASQRVEFRVRTNAEARIGQILKAAEE